MLNNIHNIDPLCGDINIVCVQYLKTTYFWIVLCENSLWQNIKAWILEN